MQRDEQPFDPSMVGKVLLVEGRQNHIEFEAVGTLAGYTVTDAFVAFLFVSATESSIFEFDEEGDEIYIVEVHS